MCPDARSNAGFTLLETLVAMTVLALLAALLLRGVVALRADAAWFEDRTGGTLLARSLIDEAVADRRLRDGTVRGARAGRRWTVTAASIDDSSPPATEVGAPGVGRPPEPSWKVQRVSVLVEAPRRPITLETVHLVRSP